VLTFGEGELVVMRALSLLSAVVSLAVAPAAMALTYGYSGNNYTLIIDNPVPAGTYTNAMSVSGSFTIAGTLAPNLGLTDISGLVTAYSFSDGRNTHTQLNSAFVGAFNVATDGAGQIIEWQLTTADGPPGVNPGDQRQVILTSNIPGFVLDRGLLQECVGASGCQVRSDVGQVANAAGVWGIVPEPSTALLLSAGLVAVAWGRRR
jgi:hypothetical protein